MTALTKSEMAERLYEELGLNKREAKEIVELFFEEIRGCLESNEQVKLSGFGNFDLRDKSQRPGRNPKTGEEIPISARRVVTFRPGQKLKARVESYSEANQPGAADGREGYDSYESSSDSSTFGMRSYDGGSE
jgi:integration host factor subunit alpha